MSFSMYAPVLARVAQQRPINTQELPDEAAASFHDLFGDADDRFGEAEQGGIVEDIPDGALLGDSMGDSDKLQDLPDDGYAQLVGDGFTDDDVAGWHNRWGPFRLNRYGF